MTIDKEQLVKLCDKIYQNNIIDKSYYCQYDVKRGLRNKNGTGVLVGLTHIGDVQGYKVEDGAKVPAEGKLYYRGIDVEDLVNACIKEDRIGYEEASYLLLFGDLPNKEELEDYKKLLGQHRELPPNFLSTNILATPSQDIMNKLGRVILSLYSSDPNPDDISIENVLIQSIKLIAQFPVLIAYAYQAKAREFDNESMHIHYPDPELGTAENLLRLIRPDGKYTEIEAKLLDLAMILHAEHGGGNNSAFTTHVISSTATDTYAVISAAIGSLKGPKHGGANKAVFEMMLDLKANVKDLTDFDEVEKYLIKLLKGEAFDKSGLIYGMGHAVYTLSDPRATLLKDMARKLAEEKDLLDEFAVYDFIEKRAPQLFKEIRQDNKVISANVDLYSGFIYNALNIPIELCTPIFAAARISGWCAHRIEEIVAGGRVIRPAYKNVRAAREYTPIAER